MKGLWSVDLEPILDFAYCQSLCKLRTGQLTRELRTANCLLFLLYVCDLSDICLIILILSILCYFFLIIFFGCLRICVLTYDTHFWGAPRIFQINYFANMSDKVERLEIWKRTTTLLMWPWPVRMVSGWKLTRWSWLGRCQIILLQSSSHKHQQHQHQQCLIDLLGSNFSLVNCSVSIHIGVSIQYGAFIDGFSWLSSCKAPF